VIATVGQPNTRAARSRLSCARFTINTGEFASLAHAIHDQLDVSLGGLLATRP
jgi:hypothetical protein